jgi:thioredoxin 1
MAHRNTIIGIMLLCMFVLILASIMLGPGVQKGLNIIFSVSNGINGTSEIDDNTSSNFIAENKFCLIEFYLPNCNLCKDMNKTASELSKELKGQMAFGRINAKNYGVTARKYNVTNYPTLLIFSNGTMVKKLSGNSNKSVIINALKGLKPGLDISGVNLTSIQNVPAKGEPEYLNLTDKSEAKPTVPLAVNDDNIGLAMQKYPYLVLNAYANWCAPCKSMSEVLDELSGELQGQVAFGMIDIGKNKEIKAKYNITSYPTLFMYKDGKLLNRSIGYRSKTTFVSWLKKYYPGLNTSKVILQAANAQGAPMQIPLAELGAQNPSRPMLITDISLDSAARKYPFLVVEGFANWCHFCADMNQTMLNLSSELRGQVAFGLIDAERNNLSRKKYNLTSYPTTIVFRNGKMVKTVVGYLQKASFVKILEQVEPNLNTSNVTVEKTQPAAPAKPKLTPEQACVNVTKSDQPLLEAFVVSRCPFGLQMLRILAEMVGKAPQAEKYVKIRYIGSVTNGTITSMHGNEEASENLRQICIREEQSDKYWDYVGCYMNEGKSAECLKSSAIDQSKLGACMNDSTRGLAYSQKDFDLANKYSITGSPTLMIGGKVVSEFDFATNNVSGRSPEALKELLCCGFNTKPSFCSQQLNTTQAITMFSVQAKTPAATTQPSVGRDIPLAKLGLKNPSQPMLITDDTIDSAISQYPLLVVMGYVDWCGFCKQLNVTVNALADELQGQVAFGLIDVERNNETKSKYNITSYPTSLIFKNGVLADKVVGALQKSSFVAKLKQVEPNLNTSKVTIEKAAPSPPRPKLTPEQACVNMTKSDQPLLVAYVVSHCPFGLQMQRIMANLTDSIPEAAKYMEVRYIGSAFDNGTITSMHGKEEAAENLGQICIREEQPNKYWDYVKCYMKEGKSGECLKSASIDVAKMNSCTNDTTRGVAYARKDFDVAKNYSITGSPTLMMNGKIVSESDFGTNTTNSRSPEAIKELLCCGFKTQPYFCKEQLNRSRAATMYSMN